MSRMVGTRKRARNGNQFSFSSSKTMNSFYSYISLGWTVVNLSKKNASTDFGMEPCDVGRFADDPAGPGSASAAQPYGWAW